MFDDGKIIIFSSSSFEIVSLHVARLFIPNIGVSFAKQRVLVWVPPLGPVPPARSPWRAKPSRAAGPERERAVPFFILFSLVFFLNMLRTCKFKIKLSRCPKIVKPTFLDY